MCPHSSLSRAVLRREGGSGRSSRHLSSVPLGTFLISTVLAEVSMPHVCLGALVGCVGQSLEGQREISQEAAYARNHQMTVQTLCPLAWNQGVDM